MESTTDSAKLHKIKVLVQSWLDEQGHDRCWYYPEVFERIAAVLELKSTKSPHLPSRAEFEQGCRKYQDKEFGKVL